MGLEVKLQQIGATIKICMSLYGDKLFLEEQHLIIIT